MCIRDSTSGKYMSKEIPWGELNTDEKPAQKTSWPANTIEVMESKRTNRSSKPEVVYYRGPVDTDRVITDQVRSPILTRHTRHETRSASAGPLDARNPATSAATPQVAGPSQAPTAQQYPPAQAQQLVVQVGVNSDDEEEDEVFTDTEDMTEDKTIGPGTFSRTTGRTETDG